MSDRAWRAIEWADCSHCGGAAETFTEVTLPEGWVQEDDDARCSECGCPGICGVDEEGDDGGAYILWHDEADCDCDWCKAHPVETTEDQP